MHIVRIVVLRAARGAALMVPLAAVMLGPIGTPVRASEPTRAGANYQITGLSPSSLPQRIGFLSSGTTELLLEDFRQGLGELGYVEGESISIEERYAEGRAERLPTLAAELVDLPVDIIVAAGAPAA